MARKIIEAWLDKEIGLFRLYGNTYPVRSILNSMGARWVSEGRYWLASKEAAERVNARFMFWARIAAHCHEPKQTIVVMDWDITNGYIRKGCPMCDTSYLCGDDVEILEVIGPAEAK